LTYKTLKFLDYKEINLESITLANAIKSVLLIASFSIIGEGSAFEASNMSGSNHAKIMTFESIGDNATGDRLKAITLYRERFGKIKNPKICTILTDSELEAFIVVSHDSVLLMKRYSEKSAEASTLGRFTNMSVMRDCEKQAQRILFYWDEHNIDAARKRYGLPKNS
jgi:hypothetical protein